MTLEKARDGQKVTQ